MSGLSALRRSGRFMVMVSKPESSFWRTISFALMGGAFVVGCREFHRHCEDRWAKAPLRRAHQLRRRDGGHATLCPRRCALFRHQWTPRGFQRLERLIAGGGREQFVVF